MQVLGSTKVAPGEKCSGISFKEVGIYDTGVTAKPRLLLPPPASAESMAPIDQSKRLLYFVTASSMLHDPWSIPFSSHGKDNEDDVASEPKRKKRKATTNSVVVVMQPNAPPPAKMKMNLKKDLMELVQQSTASAEDEEASSLLDALVIARLTNWDQLPEQWMRTFMEARDGTTYLSWIPSMNEAKYWCETVVRLVNAGRAEVILYAYVNRASMCARTLLSEGRVYRHANNSNAMVMSIQMLGPAGSSRKDKCRMFMRCFSSKCRGLPPHQRCDPKGWVEILPSDLESAAVLAVVRPTPKEKAAEAPPAAATAEEESSSLSHMMTMMMPFCNSWERLQQRQQKGWVSMVLRGAEQVYPPLSDAMRVPPACMLQYLASGAAVVVVCGSLSSMMDCPRASGCSGNVHACVIEHVEASSGAYMCRVFMRCSCAFCGTFVEPWLEMHKKKMPSVAITSSKGNHGC